MKPNRASLSTPRGVRIFEVMVEYRRNFCADADFFRMPEIWDDLCDEEGRWTINLYRSPEGEEFRQKAGIVAFGDRVVLTVDERLMTAARKGCNLSNFILAHEFGHLALGHHNRNAVTKNFRLVERPNGPANVSPTLEEFETDFAAVCFQCGVALLDTRWNAVHLANRASSDVNRVRKFQKMIQLDVFRKELARQKTLEQLRPKPPRVVL